jgi:hypothetical protein
VVAVEQLETENGMWIAVQLPKLDHVLDIDLAVISQQLGQLVNVVAVELLGTGYGVVIAVEVLKLDSDTDLELDLDVAVTFENVVAVEQLWSGNGVGIAFELRELPPGHGPDPDPDVDLDLDHVPDVVKVVALVADDIEVDTFYPYPN